MTDQGSDYPFEVLQPLPVDAEGETIFGAEPAPLPSSGPLAQLLDLTSPPPPSGPPIVAAAGDATVEFGFDDFENPDAPLDANPYAVPEVEQLLDQAIDEIAEARSTPMSTMVKINREEILDLLEQARDQLPEELRAARWLLKEREAFIARSQQEREDILDQGRVEVGRMVERQEIVRQAEHRARQIVDEARSEARLLNRRVEDFCDQKLADFEMLIARTERTVRKGREQLLGDAAMPPPPGPRTEPNFDT